MGLIRKALLGAVLSLALYQLLSFAFFDAFAAWRFAPDKENTAGKRVLVTGSSKGIGRELAVMYSELGAHVTVHGRNLAALKEVASECRNKGAASVHTVVGDMSKVGEAEKTVQSAASSMGGLDIVIVNHISAYVFETLHSAVSRIRSGQLQRDLQVDLFSYAEAALAAVPHLEKSPAAGGGSIVFVSSVAARIPVPYFYEYGFAKRSLEGLVDTVRQELALNGSTVHAGLAILSATDTPSARKLLPLIFSGPIQYASVRKTAEDIASVAVGRIRQLVTPWSMKPLLMMLSMWPESAEKNIREMSKRL